MTTATGTREPEMGLTFEKVWAMFQETDRKFQTVAQQMRESREETERLMQKSREETERLMRESSEKTERFMQKLSAETNRKMQETNEQLGRLGNRFGELAEHLVAPGILEKFNALGFVFTRCSPNASFKDKAMNLALEIDLFLENGDCAVAVEVKANLDNEDVEKHVKRMEKLHRYADAHWDARKFYGGVAGAIVSDEVREYALENGFYVITQSGDTMTIDVPDGFTSKAWHSRRGRVLHRSPKSASCNL